MQRYLIAFGIGILVSVFGQGVSADMTTTTTTSPSAPAAHMQFTARAFQFFFGTPGATGASGPTSQFPTAFPSGFPVALPSGFPTSLPVVYRTPRPIPNCKPQHDALFAAADQLKADRPACRSSHDMNSAACQTLMQDEAKLRQAAQDMGNCSKP